MRQINELGAYLNTAQPEGTTPDESRDAPAVDPPPKKEKKLRIWERQILKDLPQVQVFAKKTSKERGEDHETSRRLSVATGLIKRCRDQEISDDIILEMLKHLWDFPDLMSSILTSNPSTFGRYLTESGWRVDGKEVQFAGMPGNRLDGLLDKESREEGAIRQAIRHSLSSYAAEQQAREATPNLGGGQEDLSSTQNEGANSTQITTVSTVAASASVVTRSTGKKRSWGSDCETSPEVSPKKLGSQDVVMADLPEGKDESSEEDSKPAASPKTSKKPPKRSKKP
jgi:hypothetical protein